MGSDFKTGKVAFTPQKEMTMSTTPSKDQNTSHRTDGSSNKDMKGNPSIPGKSTGSNPDVSRTTPPSSTNKSPDLHKSGDHR
jgi:hypothetical protein